MNLHIGIQNEAYKLTCGTDILSRRAQINGFPQEISLSAAQNDTAAFEIVFYGDCDFLLTTGRGYRIAQDWSLPTVRVAIHALTDGVSYPATVQRIDQHIDDDNRTRADALLTSDSFILKRGATHSLWAEIRLPEDAHPGNCDYAVTFYQSTRSTDETVLAEVTAHIEILPYRMPTPQEYRFHLDLWQHSSNLSRKHEVPLWSDAHFAVLENYVRSLGELGQKAATIVASDIPWQGQGCVNEERRGADLYEYNIISVTKDNSGVFHYDYTAMQRYIDLCAKYGIDREISVYGLCNVWALAGEDVAPDYPDGVRVSYIDEADGCRHFLHSAAEIDDYIRSLYEYFRETGQLDKVRLAADEPGDVEKYRRILSHIFAIAPGFHCKAAINHAEFIGEFGGEVYDFAPYIDCVLAEYDKLLHYKATMRGKRFLWYVCCGPEFPNTFLRSSLAESYLIGVITSFAGLDGFLRWNYTVFNDDPRADIRYYIFPAGDTNFVYPAKNGAPLLTLRYKALRRGIELYELLERAKETAPDAAQAAFDTLLHTEKWGDPTALRALPATLDYTAYATVRRNLILALSGKQK